MQNPDSDDKEKFNFILKKIFKEEVLNSKKGKDYDELVLFIRNCFKYNLKEYLSDAKYFRNKEIRKKITNTDLMENIYQSKSPFGYQKEFQKKFYAGNYYKIIKENKNEKADYLTSQVIEKDYFQYLNFLSESSTYKKLDNYKENKIHNDKLISEFFEKENILENVVGDLAIDQQISENFYIDFLMKMKEKEKEQSIGLSEADDKLFAKRLAENKEAILQDRNTENNIENEELDNFDKVDVNRDESNFNSFTHNIVEENLASYLQNGIDSPYPYYSENDYPYDEFFNDSYMKDCKR